MDRRELMGWIGAGAAGLLVAGESVGQAQEHSDPKREEHLRILGACIRACNEASHHCLEHLKTGTGEHREHHAKAHAIRYGTNSDCFYGHVHDLQCYSNYGGHISQCLGCLCLSPKWMQGRPNRWVQCFAVFEFFPSGNYSYSIVRI